MIKKHYYSWTDVEQMCTQIVNQMYADNWTPDYIVGITRGGNIPATIISNMTGIRCEALKVSLRDGEAGSFNDSAAWMAEDAYGVLDGKIASGSPTAKKILIVDDINDTGATFKWIREDWQSGCLPNSEGWNDVWNDNVRFATMCEKTHTKFDGVDYYWKEIDTSEEDTWIVFPWEYDE